MAGGSVVRQLLPLPAHFLLPGFCTDHGAESRPAVPGITDEGKDEPNGEDTQGGHGAVTGDCIVSLTAELGCIQE